MICKASSIPKVSCISRWVFCDDSDVLTWISSAKGWSSISAIIYISLAVGNTRLSLVRDLKCLSNAGGWFINAYSPDTE